MGFGSMQERSKHRGGKRDNATARSKDQALVDQVGHQRLDLIVFQLRCLGKLPYRRFAAERRDGVQDSPLARRGAPVPTLEE